MFSKWENKTENLTILPRLLSKEQTSMHPQRSDTTASLCRHASHSQLVSVTLSNKQNFLCQSIYKQCWVSTVWEKTIPAKAVARDLQANCSRDLTAVCRRPQLLCSYQKAGDDQHDTRSQTWMLLWRSWEIWWELGCIVWAHASTGHTASTWGRPWVACSSNQMKHKQALCPLLFFLSDDGPVPQHGPAQRSTVQAELIYPSAVQSNLNKQISPYQHLEPLTYRDVENHSSPVL